MSRKIRWVAFVVTLLCATSFRSVFGAPAQSAQRTNHDAGGTHTIAESRVVAGTLELTGNCLRIGVKNTGSLGIGLTTSPGILFDKTCTGTFNPAYDFLTPGIPWEDLSLKLDGVQYHENNNRPHDFVTNASIENKSGVEYRGTTWALRAVQKSENAAFSIENDFHFNEYSKFIEIHTYVTPKAAVTTLFISRAIDSDAMIDSLDMSGTNNAMGYSTLTANYVVLSETTSTKYVMGLYTGMENGTHTGISRYWSSDPEEYYNGVNYGNGDNTIGVAARFTAVAANTTVVFKHAYIFGQSAYEGVKSAIDEGVAGGTAGSTPGCTGSASVCAPVDVGSAVKTITPGGPTLTRFPTGTPYPTRTGGLSPTPVPSTPSGSTATKTVTRSPTVISTATRSTTRTATTIPTSTTTSTPMITRTFTKTSTRTATLTYTASPIPYLMRKGAVGASFVLGLLQNGTVITWGMNREYQANVPPCCGSGITDIAVGTNFALALKGGMVFGWGANTKGQLKFPGTTKKDVVSIAAGGAHGLALTNQGTVLSWGDNAFKQTTIPSGLKTVMQIAGGNAHSLAIKKDGTVVAWGANESGQTKIPVGLKDVVQVAGGLDHSLALKKDGTVVGWGGNAYGQSSVPANAVDMKQVSAGNQFSLSVKKDGTVMGWGRSDNNVYVIPPEYTDIYTVAAGYTNTILGLHSGRVVVLGDQANGVGISRTPTKTATPTP